MSTHGYALVARIETDRERNTAFERKRLTINSQYRSTAIINLITMHSSKPFSPSLKLSFVFLEGRLPLFNDFMLTVINMNVLLVDSD